MRVERDIERRGNQTSKGRERKERTKVEPKWNRREWREQDRVE